MKQETIQYINQLEIEGVVNLPIIKSGGLIQVKLGYTFEANINPGVNRNIYSPVEPAPQDILKEAKKQLYDWKEKAKGKELNHYFKIGVRISY